MPYTYPLAPKRAFTFECAGRTLEDDYAWMEPNGDDTRAWVAEENAFTDAWFPQGMVDARAEALATRPVRPAYGDYNEIYERGGKLYAARTAADGSPAAVELDKDFGELRVLLDEQMAGGAYQAYSVKPAPGRDDLFAFFILKNGAARYSVLVRDDKTGEDLAVLDGIFSFKWAPDGSSLYYADAETDVAAGVNINNVRAFDIATRQSRLLYREEDPAIYIMLEVAADGGVFAHVNLNYNDVRLLHIDPKTGAATRVNKTDKDSFNYIGSIAGVHYVFTSRGAPRGRLVALEGLSFEGAADILPQQARQLKGVCVAGDKLLAVYMNDAASEAEVYDPQGKLLYPLALPDAAGNLSVVVGRPPEFQREGGHLYMTYQSFVCPPALLRYSPATGALETVYTVREGGLRTDVTVEKCVIPARDGARLVAFLVRKNGAVPNGKNPVLMFGYGGFAVSMPPCYTNEYMGMDVVDWVDRGGIYVHCIIRGGAEFGAEWHDQGRLKNKKNVFCDFIDIAEWLVAQGWTAPGKIAINGASNGGLLVTAAVTMRPDLFGAVVASVPVADSIRRAGDDRAQMDMTEYGDPRSEEMFEYILSYSPYHNIKAGVAYPPVYVQTGEFDNNVPPYHSKKFVAKMQALGTGGPCLLRVLARGSHDRGTGEVFYRTTAEMQLFAELGTGLRP